MAIDRCDQVTGTQTLSSRLAAGLDCFDDDTIDAAWELGATVGATIADEGAGSGDGQH